MTHWENRFADRTQHMRRSTVREILKLTGQPDMISFAGGLPAPELFPVERVQQATDTVLAERGREALQYSTTEGMPELRAFVAEWISGPNMRVNPNNILILSGAQQAIDLLGRVLLNDGDPVLMENPTYVGTLSAWAGYGLKYHSVPTDHDGMLVEEILSQLHHHPRLMYSIPNFQNPQGVTLSLERRKRLAQILVENNLTFIEDDPYGQIRYSGEHLPSMLQLEAAERGSLNADGNVIFCGTFSKVLTPGQRIGWVAAHEMVIDKLVQAKQGADLHTSTLGQFITYELVKDTAFFEAHVEMLRGVYRERRDLMLRLLDEHFPPEVSWTHPDGGLFLMVTLPAHLDATDLLKEAVQHKVAFVPCDGFYLDGTGQNTFRLNFSNARPEMITTGVERLGALIKQALVRQPT
jgi:2-aminoadipate transaminase